MSRQYKNLRTVLWAVVGLWVFYAVYAGIRNAAQPEINMVNSAPWYTGVLITGILVLPCAALLLLAMHLVKRKDDRNGRNGGNG